MSVGKEKPGGPCPPQNSLVSTPKILFTTKFAPNNLKKKQDICSKLKSKPPQKISPDTLTSARYLFVLRMGDTKFRFTYIDLNMYLKM